MGSKELLDLIGEMIFSEGEEDCWQTLTQTCPGTGTSGAHTMFMNELYEQL
jgi:hypothetical protein